MLIPTFKEYYMVYLLMQNHAVFPNLMKLSLNQTEPNNCPDVIYKYGLIYYMNTFLMHIFF